MSLFCNVIIILSRFMCLKMFSISSGQCSIFLNYFYYFVYLNGNFLNFLNWVFFLMSNTCHLADISYVSIYWSLSSFICCWRSHLSWRAFRILNFAASLWCFSTCYSLLHVCVLKTGRQILKFGQIKVQYFGSDHLSV